MLLPGSTLGMLGGGQLGRLFAMSARSLGYKVIVVEPDPTSPAGQVADEHIIAAYDDENALERLGKACDVITTEFENIPADVLRKLSNDCPVFPPADALEKAQDRIVEKEFILSCGLLPVPYGVITTKSDIAILRSYGFTITARKSNPRQKDRLNAVNNLFKSKSGKIRYYVDPSCKKTIEDFNKVESLDDGKLNKKSEKSGLVHISDALGYAVYYHFPFRGKDKVIKQ